MPANDDERVVATVHPRSDREVRVSIGRINGSHKLRLSIRRWFARDGEMLPSTDGIELPLDDLPDMADAISLALERARTWQLIK